jgi:hypothetical protein
LHRWSAGLKELDAGGYHREKAFIGVAAAGGKDELLVPQ